MTQAELTERVHLAFADSVYPGDKDIIGWKPKSDPLQHEMEWDTVWRVLHGKDWRECTSEELHECELVWFTANGFHYYIPAYLLAGMKDGDIAFYTTRAFDRGYAGAARRLFKMFSREQLRVICDVLQWYLHHGMADEEDAKPAIDRVRFEIDRRQPSGGGPEFGGTRFDQSSC